MNLEKEFVPHQESLELKQLGFDERCISFYDEIKFSNNIKLSFLSQKVNDILNTIKNTNGTLISAPTFSQAFRWFREKYNLYHDIKMFGDWNKPQFSYIVSGKTMNNLAHMWHYESTDSYEKAELACLRKLIEIVKEKR